MPLALGTDTGGSVRNPAGACGVVGLKPTYGLVSRRGVFPLAFTLDHVGPMARSVGDIALLLDTLAGHDPADPGSVATASRRFGEDLGRGVRGLRIGFVRHFHETDLPADPEIAAALDEAARVLEAEGAHVRTVTLPSLREFSGVQRVIMLAESWAIHAGWLRERPGDYSASSRRKLMSGAFLSAGDYVSAQQRRSALIGAVDDVFRDVDALLCASAMDPACRIDDAEAVARTYPRQARNPFNLTGHPALAMMGGLSRAGLPLPVQLVGRSHDEVTLLRVAAAFERATAWHQRQGADLSRPRRSGRAADAAPVARRSAGCRRSVGRQPLANLPAPVGRRLIVAASGTLQGHDAALDRIADLSPGHAQVVLGLEAQPELGARAEEARQPQGGVRRDSPPAAHHLRDSSHGYIDPLRESIRRKAEGAHEILFEDLAWVDRFEPPGNHVRPLSGSRRSQRRRRLHHAKRSRFAIGR